MEENIGETIEQLVQALTGLTQKIDEMDSRINELDSVIYDGLIGPANEQMAQNEYDNALSDFRTKYAEKLGPFEGASKAIEGDDFDLYKSAFDGYNEGDYEFSPDEYVDKICTSLADQIAKVREAVAEKENVAPEDVDVNVNAENGEVTVDVDNKTTEEKPEDNVKEETTTEEPSKEEGDTEEEVDEFAEFEKSLRDEAEKDKDHSWIRG